MKHRFLLFQRSGIFYSEDTTTGRQLSLRTRDRTDAQRLLAAKNEANHAPAINLQLAQVYLQHGDPAMTTRTWQDVLAQIIAAKSGKNKLRWQSVPKDKALESLWARRLLETTAEHFLTMLQSGTVSTNQYLRRLHHFAVTMHWLPWPVLPPRNWPPIRYGERRAITREEHQKILEREQNPAWRAYYHLLWHLGGAQTDMANLQAEDVDWTKRTIAYRRCKTGVVSLIAFNGELAEVLKTLATSGHLLPSIAKLTDGRRSTRFACRLKTLGIAGVSLHSYRYAWAERAKEAGYPERYAMQALGHSSKAVHRAYAKKADFILPPLADYEKKMAAMPGAHAVAARQPETVAA